MGITNNYITSFGVHFLFVIINALCICNEVTYSLQNSKGAILLCIPSRIFGVSILGHPTPSSISSFIVGSCLPSYTLRLVMEYDCMYSMKKPSALSMAYPSAIIA